MAKAKKQIVVEEKAQPLKKAAPRVKAAKHRTAPVPASPIEELQPVAHENTQPENTHAQNHHAMIAAVAYSYWESRGYQGGDALEDWVRAENELRPKTMAASA
jgi:hypothetical protein